MHSDQLFVRLSCPQGVAHDLRAVCHPQMTPFIRLWKDNPTSVPIFIPAVSEMEFCIESLVRDTHLFFLKYEVDVKSWQDWSFFDNLKWARLSRFHRFTKFRDGELVIQPFLHHSTQALDVARTARTLAKWGFAVSAPALQDTLSYEFLDHPRNVANPFLAHSTAIAVVVHLHYDKLWPDFASRLSRLSVPFQLFLTVSGEHQELKAKVHSQFPDAEIITYPNRGRDVGPFIQLLRDGYLDAYDLVCKVHGKRSADSGPRAVFGEIWRRSMLNDLLGSDTQVRMIVNRFMVESEIGLIGPANFRLPNEHRHSYTDTWGANERLTTELARQVGHREEQFKLDFFAGTMFWIRRELLDLLKSLDLSLNSFSEEKGQTDGTLQHALERLFGALPSVIMPPMKIGMVNWRRTQDSTHQITCRNEESDRVSTHRK